MAQKVDIVEYRFTDDGFELFGLCPETTLEDVFKCLSVPRESTDIVQCMMMAHLIRQEEVYYGPKLAVPVGAIVQCVKRNIVYTDLIFGGQKLPRVLVFNANVPRDDD